MSKFGLAVAFVVVIAVTWLFASRYQSVVAEIAMLEDRITVQQEVIDAQSMIIGQLVEALLASGLSPEDVQGIIKKLDVVEDSSSVGGGGPGTVIVEDTPDGPGKQDNVDDPKDDPAQDEPPPSPEPEPEPSPCIVKVLDVCF